MNPSSQTPGWYPDPFKGAPADGMRYFDGTDWTHRSSPATAPEELGPPKSAVAAGLLQLFFGWLGLGRFYIGSLGIALTQLILGILGILLWVVLMGWIIQIPLAIWAFIDAILMFSGNVKDKDGRNLR